MRKEIQKNSYILLFLLAISLFSCGKDKQEPTATANKVTRQGFSMGTTLEIQIVTDQTEKADSAITAGFTEIQRINDKYSTYQTDNYIFDMNSSDSMIVDEETAYLLTACDKIYNLTQGRFDPAVGNLIKLIGFESNNPHLPSQDSINLVLSETGWKHIDIAQLPLLRKRQDIQINFGGIAKGYAVDRAAEIIESFGFGTYMVNAGGEIQARGKVWSVGLSHPRKQGEIIGAVQLNNISIATSGDYEQYFKKDGKRYSHIIDPVTGMPSDNSQAVSIITDKCIFADGIATGIFVLGPKKGLEIINGLDEIECMIVSKQGEIFESENFGEYFKK